MTNKQVPNWSCFIFIGTINKCAMCVALDVNVVTTTTHTAMWSSDASVQTCMHLFSRHRYSITYNNTCTERWTYDSKQRRRLFCINHLWSSHSYRLDNEQSRYYMIFEKNSTRSTAIYIQIWLCAVICDQKDNKNNDFVCVCVVELYVRISDGLMIARWVIQLQTFDSELYWRFSYLRYCICLLPPYCSI